jgi:broad specificity phosphatase PhoE
MPEWINQYDAAGIRVKEHFSRQTWQVDGKAKLIVCSNLPRAIHTAQIIDNETSRLVDGIFREAELPAIQIPIIRLTPHQWSMVFRVFWFAGVSTKVESLFLFKQRAALAVEKLIQLAELHDSLLLVLVGHGIINRFLAKGLISRGWAGDESPHGKKYWGYRYWEYACYTKI